MLASFSSIARLSMLWTLRLLPATLLPVCALYWLLLHRLASHRLHIPSSSSRTCLISYPSLCPLLHTCWFLGSGSLCSVGHFSSRLASYHLIALRTHACTHITSHHTSILARRNISISSCCISTSQTHSGALSLPLLRIYLALGSKVIMLTRHRQLNTQKDIITSTSLRLPATAFARRRTKQLCRRRQASSAR